jgi:hypothetical protein
VPTALSVRWIAADEDRWFDDPRWNEVRLGQHECLGQRTDRIAFDTERLMTDFSSLATGFKMILRATRRGFSKDARNHPSRQ